MKILVITNYLPQYSIDFYLSVLNKLSGDSLIIVADVKSNVDVNQFTKSNFLTVIHNKLYQFMKINYRFGLIKLLFKENPDHIIIYGNPRDLSVYIFLFISKLLGYKTAVYGMFHKIGRMKFLTRFAYRILYALSSKVFTYSRKGAETLYAIGCDTKKIFVIGTAINNKRIEECLRKTNVKKRQLYIRKLYPNLKSKVVLQSVRLSKIKKPYLLIEAANLICETRNDISFVIIGGGELFHQMQNLVIKKNLNDFFIFLGPVYEEDILANWFSIASCGIVPTCIGLSLHHYFSYGVPVITDDSIENQTSEFDIIIDRINGLVYPEGNIKVFADLIIKLCDDEILRDDLSNNALMTIHRNSNMNRKVISFLNALDLKINTPMR